MATNKNINKSFDIHTVVKFVKSTLKISNSEMSHILGYSDPSGYRNFNLGKHFKGGNFSSDLFVSNIIMIINRKNNKNDSIKILKFIVDEIRKLLEESNYHDDEKIKILNTTDNTEFLKLAVYAAFENSRNNGPVLVNCSECLKLRLISGRLHTISHNLRNEYNLLPYLKKDRVPIWEKIDEVRKFIVSQLNLIANILEKITNCDNVKLTLEITLDSSTDKDIYKLCSTKEDDNFKLNRRKKLAENANLMKIYEDKMTSYTENSPFKSNIFIPVRINSIIATPRNSLNHDNLGVKPGKSYHEIKFDISEYGDKNNYDLIGFISCEITGNVIDDSLPACIDVLKYFSDSFYKYLERLYFYNLFVEANG